MRLGILMCHVARQGSCVIRQRFRLRYQTHIALWGFLFALPAVLYLALFNLYPMANAFYLSFTRYDLISPPEFVGMRNYVQTLTSEAFQHSLRVTFVYVFGTVIPVWFLSFGVAMLLSRARVFSGGWRTLLFIPTILPLLTVTLVWKLLFNLRGPVNGAVLLRGHVTDPLADRLALCQCRSHHHELVARHQLLHDPLPGRPAGRADRLPGGGRAGWRQRLAAPAPRDPAAHAPHHRARRRALHHQRFSHLCAPVRDDRGRSGHGNGDRAAADLQDCVRLSWTWADATAMSVLYFLMILVFSLIQLRVLQGEHY